MLRRLSVRGKILATLAVPVLVLVIAAVIIAGQSIATAVTADQSKAIAQATKSHDALMTALQDEYDVTLDNASAGDKGSQAIAKARTVTDAARAEYLAKAEPIDLSVYSGEVESAWSTAASSLKDIDASRSAIDDALADVLVISRAPVINSTYRKIIDSQAGFYGTLIDALTDRSTARSFDLYRQTFLLRADYADEVRLATPLLTRSEPSVVQGGASGTQGAITPAATLAANAVQATNAGLTSVTDKLDQLGLSQITVPQFSYNLGRARATVLAGRGDHAQEASVVDWPKDTATFSTALADTQDSIRAEVIGVVAEASSEAWTRAWLTVAAVLLAIFLSVLLALLIARQVTRPLSLLTAAAGRVRDELPKLVEQSATPGELPDMSIEPIDLESHDEIGQLADAFNEVNDTTVSVAREQAALRGSIAEMFVNVARRDHALLNRQLSFLDDLERTEEDPTTLSNLFRLDHLATRMRRNSESLLVLAGIDSGRRVREGMPLSDVIRTASSEIEAYDRVELLLSDDPTMLGHHALNAAHLLAELLENATMFSDPSSMIEVSTQTDRYYVSVVVKDHGLGMTPEELEAANKKLSSRTASDVVGSQRLGLFVVGRIADRLGAHVTFDSAEGGGTLVTTAFPRGLFVGMDEYVEPGRSGDAGLPGAEAVPAEPIDLATLTDGQTDAGIPRRKARAAEPVAAAPSVGLTAELNEEDIILPAIETPVDAGAGLDEATEGDAWQPLQITDDPIGSGLATRRTDGSGGLPSRTPAAPAVVDLDTPEVAAPVGTAARSAMFSSFRARDALIPAATDEVAPAADEVAEEPQPEPFVVPGLAPDGDESWSQTSAWATPSSEAETTVMPAFGAAEPVDADSISPVVEEPAEVAPSADLWVPPTEPAVSQPDAWTPPAEPEPEPWAPTVADAVEQPASEPVPASDEAFAPEPLTAEPVALDPVVSEPAAPAQVAEDTFGLDFVPVDPFAPVVRTDVVPGVQPVAEAQPPVAPEVAPEPVRRLPRHAAPDDLERLAREIESGEQAIGAQAIDEVAGSAEQVPGLVDDEPAPPAADLTSTPELSQWHVPGLADDETAPDGVLDAAAADVVPVPEPAGFEAAGYEAFGSETAAAETAPDGAPAEQTTDPLLAGPAPFGPTDEWVDQEAASALARPESFAPEQPAPAAEVPDGISAGLVPEGAAPAVPAFADVIADVPSEPEPKKKGLLGRLFGGGRKGKDEVEETAAAAPTVAPATQGAPPPVFAPTSGPAPEPYASGTSFTVQPATEPFAAPAPAESLAPEQGVSYAPVVQVHDEAPGAPAPHDHAAYEHPTFDHGAVVGAPADESAFPVAPSSFGPDGEPTMTAYAQAYPDAQAEAALQAASSEGAWSPQAAFEPAPWTPEASAPGLAPRRGGAEQVTEPAAPSAWTPNGPDDGASSPGSMSPELAAMLASRADIQEQALSELSQLSSYRPAAVEDQPAGGLVRRQRAEVAAPADDPTSQKISRDASLLRSRLSAFQSGTSRGRQDGVGNDAPSSDLDPSSDATTSSAVRPS